MRGTIGPRATATARFLNRVGLGGVNHVLKRLLQLTSSDRLTVEADGFVIEGPAVAWRILNQLAAGIYKPFEVQLFKEALRPGMVVVDVGANVGYYTLVAARAVGETGKVFAFEPDPRTRNALARNLEANSIHNVVVIDKAATDVAGSHELYLSTSANRSSLFRSPSLEHETGATSVETTTADAALDGAQVDVVKMNINGAEASALRGMQRSLKPGAVLFLEFRPALLPSAGTDPDEFASFLFSRFETVEKVEGERLISISETPDDFAYLRCRGWR